MPLQTHRLCCCLSSLLLLANVELAAASDAAEPASVTQHSAQFDVKLDAGAIVSLKSARDPFHTEYVRPGARLGDVTVRFRHPGGDWQTVQTAELTKTAALTTGSNNSGSTARYAVTEGTTPVMTIEIRLAMRDGALDWDLSLENAGEKPLEIGDLALPLPMNSSFKKDTSAVLKHSFISGNGSFLFWMRPDSAGPYLTLTPAGDTRFEYWEAMGGYRIFIHSAAAGAAAREHGTQWRQPNTSVTLAPKGQAGAAHAYGCKFHWADSFDAVRQLLVDEGGIDVQVVPGMTVPTDLFARIALRSKAEIKSVEAEFPEATQVEAAGSNGEYRIYQVRFSKLGENRLTVNYGDQRRTYLEFFATEPLETLIRKRAAFITRCQHTDPKKWYNSLFSEWNMETRDLLGPDNYDRIKGWRIYEVTCDDPGLSKPAFLAAKNADYPVQSEVAAMDNYLKNFVWGGLQRSTDEKYAYGIYGIPDWKINRDSADPGKGGKLHIWRVYDYPHVILMYWSMYRVARDNPQIKTDLTAAQYLQRAYGTALAMFTVPKEIANWSAYETGFYNELVIGDLIRELVATGQTTEADQLRAHWEKKVRYFVNGKPNLFQSEYAFDSTGMESTQALASYAVEHADRPGTKQLGVTPEAARQFMETQMKANLFCRGGIEPAYYYLGSDYRGSAGNAYTLTYMAQMGGWAVLDYALHYAADPAAYLRLGYASSLSSWALMNTGTAASNYGYWYPGRDNDGAAGGGFEPAPYGVTWLGQPHHRGSWYYACEIDLGYCAGLRAAATVLADDPIFGRFCFGGEMRGTDKTIEIIPRDGVRRRFHARLGKAKQDMMLESDRFAAEKPIALNPDLSKFEFSLESDQSAAHRTKLRIGGLGDGKYALTRVPEKLPCSTFSIKDGKETAVELPLGEGGVSSFTIERLEY